MARRDRNTTVANSAPQEFSDLTNAFFRFTFLTALVVAAACVVVRWVLPPLLVLLCHSAQDLIDLAAACAVLPEYWISTANRRRSKSPPSLLAYEYGCAVGAIAHVVHTIVGWAFRIAAKVAQTVHPLVVGVVAGALEISLLASWI